MSVKHSQHDCGCKKGFTGGIETDPKCRLAVMIEPISPSLALVTIRKRGMLNLKPEFLEQNGPRMIQFDDGTIYSVVYVHAAGSKFDLFSVLSPTDDESGPHRAHGSGGVWRPWYGCTGRDCDMGCADYDCYTLLNSCMDQYDNILCGGWAQCYDC